jgi:hypothetical protein
VSTTRPGRSLLPAASSSSWRVEKNSGENTQGEIKTFVTFFSFEVYKRVSRSDTGGGPVGSIGLMPTTGRDFCPLGGMNALPSFSRVALA